jgi:hypothetical protein
VKLYSRIITHIGSQKYWYIYRENYSLYGKMICKILHEQFGGPPCPATGEAAWKAACADAKSKGKFTHIDSHQVICGPSLAQRDPAKEKCAPGMIEPCEGGQ